MNPYQPPDADESQLDRIERKIDKLSGEFVVTLLLGAVFTLLVFLLVEIVSARWKF
jgi:hypothetical protein